MEQDVRVEDVQRPAATGACDYPPIGDYALIGDCRAAALVSCAGAIDWLCLPHFSGPSIFAAVLDRQRGGHFTVRPVGRYAVTRRYWPGTNVLETAFTTDNGTARLIDCMPILGGARRVSLLQPQRELLRVIEGLDGTVELEAVYMPRPLYAELTPQLLARGRLGWSCNALDHMWMLHTDITLEPSSDATLRGRWQSQPGARRYFSLTYAQDDMGTIVPVGRDAAARLNATKRWWEDWHEHCSYRGPYREAVIRSALTLKLLTYQLSGAIVAAPTASLPEEIGGTRNWDYRFCWLRDAALTSRALFDLGLYAEGDAFLGWLLHTVRRRFGSLGVLYDVHGEHALNERTLTHLEGYCSSRPVRIGNAANRQRQWDVYGEVIQAAFEYVVHGGTLQRDEQRLLIGLGKAVCRLWREPDNGIWEVRGALKHYTYSKFMCWLALDRLIQLTERGVLKCPGGFARERAAIDAAIEAQGYSETHGSYTAVLGGNEVDASLLLMAPYGYRDATDARLQNTCRRIERELTCDGGLLYRYRPGTDGLPGHEGAFTIASFWMIDYLARAGRIDDAVARFETLLTHANDLGLYAEEIEPDTNAALGNFPQAFSHVGLITAAISLERARSGHAHRTRG